MKKGTWLSVMSLEYSTDQARAPEGVESEYETPLPEGGRATDESLQQALKEAMSEMATLKDERTGQQVPRTR